MNPWIGNTCEIKDAEPAMVRHFSALPIRGLRKCPRPVGKAVRFLACLYVIPTGSNGSPTKISNYPSARAVVLSNGLVSTTGDQDNRALLRVLAERFLYFFSVFDQETSWETTKTSPSHV